MLAGKAVERLNDAPVERVIFSDTVPVADRGLERLTVASVAPLLARAIDRIHRSESVSLLFEERESGADK